MAVKIPYVDSPGGLIKILRKIMEAGTPDTFNYDFLSTKLGFKGGSARTFISWAKKLNLLSSDGKPTHLYRKFRNPTSSKASMAEAMREGYRELYDRNEYCHELDKKDFKGLVMEATGLPHDSRVVEQIVSTFFNAKTFADFDTALTNNAEEATDNGTQSPKELNNQSQSPIVDKKLKLGLSYTINLVLPKTDDPSIYNAIFKSLKENLLAE